MDVGDHGNSRFDVLSATSRKNPTTRDFYFNHGALKYLAFVDSFADPSVPLGNITKVFAVMMKSNSVAIKFVGRLGNHIQLMSLRSDRRSRRLCRCRQAPET